MERNIHKQIKLNSREARDLADKARRACLSESGLIRALIRGYEPTEKPDDRFYEFTEQLNDVAEALQTIADVAHASRAFVQSSFTARKSQRGRKDGGDEWMM